MKFRTIYDGEKAIVVNRNGEKKIYDGPKRVFLFLEKLEKLNQFVADSNQYLKIKYLDGETVHKPGPVTDWFNRFEHESIKVENALILNASQLIIVYNRDPKTNEVIRRIIEGPIIFMPEANEWLHQFKWHMQDPDEPGHLIPNGNNFIILTNKPDFIHYNVKEVRTKDDSLITIKLMVIYELQDIFTMLDKTQDPIADFINAICADVVSYVAKLTFTEFLNEGANKLNKLETYEQLLQRAERNGYKIETIIYSGYLSSDALQNIQDSAIQSRTQLRLNAEIDEQKNRLIDLKLKSQNENLLLESQLNKLRFEFDQKIKDSQAKFELKKSQMSHQVDLDVKILEQESNKEVDSKKQQINEEFLAKLNDLGVDVNKYLLNHKVDRLYELVN